MSGEGENNERVGNNYFYCFPLISVPLQKESVGGSDSFVISDQISLIEDRPLGLKFRGQGSAQQVHPPYIPLSCILK